MAIFSTSNVSVNAIGACVPQKVNYIRDYDWITEKERDQVTFATGIEERRFAPKRICTSDMAVDLCRKLFAETATDINEIDVLLFVSQSRDYILPNTACIIQDRLGLSKRCLAFDIPLGCSGYVYGLSVLSGMLSSAGGALRKAVMIAGDVSSFYLNYRDKSTYPLFGDAVSATLLSYNKNEKNPLQFSLQTDGSGYDALIIPDCGNRNDFSDETLVDKEYNGIWRTRRNVWLDGMRIFQFTVTEVANNIEELLKHYEVEIDSIDKFILHQANKIMNETVRKQLRIKPEKVPYSLKKFGNTSSASIPLTIVTELIGQGQNQKWLLSGFGVGLSWGSLIMSADNIFILPLLEIDYAE
jgi:3-oxoacyl-[acyl-carrier-protein] synthase III